MPNQVELDRDLEEFRANIRQLEQVRWDQQFGRWWNNLDEELAQPRQQVQVIRPGELIREGPMIKFKRGEDLFRLVLEGIKEIYDTNAVIAGGAVRDLAAGVPNSTKDVDVFIPMSVEDFQSAELELGWQGKFEIKAIKGYPIIQGQGNRVGCMFPTSGRAAHRVQGMLLDLVFKDEPLTEAEVATFPVFAQRCVFSLNGGMELFPEAKHDIENKTFTIDPTITDKDKIKAVLAKIAGWKQRDAYRDWTTVEPDVPEWWEAKEQIKVDQNKPLTPENTPDFWNKYWGNKLIVKNGHFYER